MFLLALFFSLIFMMFFQAYLLIASLSSQRAVALKSFIFILFVCFPGYNIIIFHSTISYYWSINAIKKLLELKVW
jgi:hypothetical protein